MDHHYERYKEISDYINLQNIPKDVDPVSLSLRILLFDRYGIDKGGVIHIGGHSGQELPMYTQLGFKKILMVEPQPSLFESMKQYAEAIEAFRTELHQLLELGESQPYPEIQCVQSVVSSQSDIVQLYQMGDTEWSSILEPNIGSFYQALNQYWRKRYIPWYQMPLAWLSYFIALNRTKVIEIESKTLDQLMSELKPGWQSSDFSYLRMNIQGSELMALQGGKETLKHLQAISLEINIDERYKGSPSKPEIDDFLSSFEFVDVFSFKMGSVGNGLYLKEAIASN
ncbi:FkbM family methyltransferase [Roseofilum capinflatum]|uniref:FkbM family methyltransferase n=1 Tax=Roseofilum capinflatum BLCC-M114 TaxID=3022440 RepID=A0ABT7B2J6_9CYAN|nr:FkbM family methyltransferase [Roseofilum capinflatum]MDJ1172879.1 FkbM family methyltransferase [Roseofilum capinflatum BLCC-M114]